MGEERRAPGSTATATPEAAARRRTDRPRTPGGAQGARSGVLGFVAVCTVAALAACGSPTSGPAVAVPGGAELTVAAPDLSATGTGDVDSQDLAAQASAPDDPAGYAPAAGGPSETPSTTRPRPSTTTSPAARPSGRAGARATAGKAAGRTASKSVTRRTATSTTGPRTIAARPTGSVTVSSPSTVVAATLAAPLTLGPGNPTADEAEVTRLVNIERVAAGCQALVAQPVLTQVARAHSQTMSSPGGFKHNSPDGRTPFQRLTAVGYDYSIAGENIAAGQPTAAAVVQAWMNSPEHKANILDCRFTQIGVGKAYVASSQYGTYWTQDLGTPL